MFDLFNGRLAAAEQAGETGLKIAREQGAQYDAALCTKALGEEAAAAGRKAEARERFASALEAFQAAGARPQEARCRAALATLAASQVGRRKHDATAQEMFAQMGMAWGPERADAPNDHSGSNRI